MNYTSISAKLRNMQDLKTLRDNFKEELIKVSKEEESSLSYIKFSLPDRQDPAPNIYQAMVLGGSNFSTARVYRAGSNIELTEINKEKLSSFSSKDELFEFILSRIDEEVDTVCLNFAFPLKPLVRENRIDGKLIQEVKDHKFPELIGENIGESLENYIFEKQNKKIKFSVANDSLCLLLAGVSISEQKNVVGAILGTGFNLGIFHDGNSAVNLEAGGFNKFIQSQTGKKIDESSKNPGQHLFEKEVSGAYLYQHFNYEITSRNIEHPILNSTQELYDIVHGEGKNEDAAKLAEDIFRRSAKLVAAAISAIAEFKNDDIDVVHQGAFFTNYYKEILMDEAENLTNHKITLCKIEDSSRLGAAHLI